MDVGGVSSFKVASMKRAPGIVGVAPHPLQPASVQQHPPFHHLSAMPSRSRKRGRAGADDLVNDGSSPKAACAAAGPAAGGEAAAAASTSPEDYSSKECWDKRYREGTFVEWYCGFDDIRPLFERFVPKVAINARM